MLSKESSPEITEPLQFVGVCKEGDLAPRGVEHLVRFEFTELRLVAGIGKCRCAFNRSATAVAAREPRTATSTSPPWTGTFSTRKRLSLPLARNGRRSYAARGRRAERRCEERRHILPTRWLSETPSRIRVTTWATFSIVACERRGNVSYCARFLGIRAR